MSLIDRLLIAAGEEKQQADSRPKRSSAHFTVPVNDYGKAEVELILGDVDGTGESPGVELVIRHPLIEDPNGASVALSGREAEELGAALLNVASRISPSDRLRPLRRRLEQQRRRKP
jgi:hypothetical protein